MVRSPAVALLLLSSSHALAQVTPSETAPKVALSDCTDAKCLSRSREDAIRSWSRVTTKKDDFFCQDNKITVKTIEVSDGGEIRSSSVEVWVNNETRDLDPFQAFTNGFFSDDVELAFGCGVEGASLKLRPHDMSTPEGRASFEVLNVRFSTGELYDPMAFAKEYEALKSKQQRKRP